MFPLSVTIITFNEEKNIGRCIDSVKKVADEIIVLDSFSSDATVEIAMQKGAIVKQKKFIGFIEQKNLALQFTSYDYVLSLDADEVLDDTLVKSILDAKMNFAYKAYTMNRCANFCGREIHHGLWYPDKKLRLFDKRIASWGGTNPHDRVKPIEPIMICRLKGNILHYSYNSLEEYFSKANNYSSISAASLHNIGETTGLGKILIHPLWSFINGYILRLGFLDGFYGFLIAINTAHYSFTKHIKLYQLQKIKPKEVNRKMFDDKRGKSLSAVSPLKRGLTKSYFKST